MSDNWSPTNNYPPDPAADDGRVPFFPDLPNSPRVTKGERRLIGCATLFLLMICGCISLVGYIAWIGVPPSDVAVTVNAPLKGSANTPFVISVIVANKSGQEQTVSSIDFSQEYMAGIEIQSAVPPFTSSELTPLLNDTSFLFNKVLAPGESVSVKFTAVGDVGDYAGKVHVCLNESQCTTDEVHTALAQGK